MGSRRLSYVQLLETNNVLQHLTDESYWLCVTRTVQESKLFPVPAYMLLSYLNAFYRYPTLLRKIEARMSAEELGDRGRALGTKASTLTMSWGLPCFYLLGREWLISMGLLRPQDAVEDVMDVMDFWRRFLLAYHRNDGHQHNKEFGQRSQILPERQLQVFDADLFPVKAGDRLHRAANQFLATVSQYVFLSHCECRIGTYNEGPYYFGEDEQLLVRNFLDLAEGDFPWLDRVSETIPYPNLTVPTVVKGTKFDIVDDWGSFESTPEFRAENVTRIGLYYSDPLTESYVPVGMDDPETLARTFDELRDAIREATAELWKRIAGWSRDQMLDAGALVYYSVPKHLAHLAGVYEQSDWFEIDERAERFRPLLNDEYSRDVLGALCMAELPCQRVNEYVLMRYAEAPKRLYSQIPYSILTDGDYTRTVGGLYAGSTHLEPKSTGWRTSQGMLTQEEFNRRVREFQPWEMQRPYRFLGETWVKYNAGTPLADELYERTQEPSRLLRGKGSGLRRRDIEKLRH